MFGWIFNLGWVWFGGWGFWVGWIGGLYNIGFGLWVWVCVGCFVWFNLFYFGFDLLMVLLVLGGGVVGWCAVLRLPWGFVTWVGLV